MAGLTSAHRHSSSTVLAAAIERGNAGRLQYLSQSFLCLRVGCPCKKHERSSEATMHRTPGTIRSRALLLGRAANLYIPIYELGAVLRFTDETGLGR